MRRSMTGQYVPTDSFLNRTRAEIKIISLLLILFAVVVTSSIIGFIFISLITGLGIRMAKMSARDALATIRPMTLFFLMIFILNTLFFETEDAFFRLGFLSLSEKGIHQGMIVVSRVGIAIIWSAIIMRSTSPMEMTKGIIALLKPLRYIGLSVDEVGMMIGIAVQFIPTLLKEAEMIRKAQIARGASLSNGSPRERAKSLIPFIIPLFIMAFRRADELSEAMEARGYREIKERGAYCQHKALSAKDIIILAGGLCLCILQKFVFC